MNKNTCVAATMLMLMLVLGMVMATAPAVAQKKMYRCGNNYQDRPCEAAPATPKPAAAPAATKSEAAPQSRAAYRQQLRCENFGRQMAELRERKKGLSRQSDLLDGQIKSLEGRMKADNC